MSNPSKRCDENDPEGTELREIPQTARSCRAAILQALDSSTSRRQWLFWLLGALIFLLAGTAFGLSVYSVYELKQHRDAEIRALKEQCELLQAKLSTKVDHSDLKTQLVAKADKAAVDELKANVTDCKSRLVAKADKAAVDQSLALKVNVNDFESSLVAKADKSAVDELKANVNDFESRLVAKADTAAVDELKANVTDCKSRLVAKADKAAVDQSLALKVNVNDLERAILQEISDANPRWRTVVNANYLQDICPADWITESGLGCRRKDTPIGLVRFSENTTAPYSKVRIVITTRVQNSPDAFWFTASIAPREGAVYVDGVGIFQSGRHLYTFADGNNALCPLLGGPFNIHLGEAYQCVSSPWDETSGQGRPWRFGFTNAVATVSLMYPTIGPITVGIFTEQSFADEDIAIVRLSIEVQ
jgi:hypothetical protein